MQQSPAVAQILLALIHDCCKPCLALREQLYTCAKFLQDQLAHERLQLATRLSSGLSSMAELLVSSLELALESRSLMVQNRRQRLGGPQLEVQDLRCSFPALRGPPMLS